MEIIPIISFLTGVISILSPCILPIIPIFVAFSLKSKTKSEILSFTLGLFSIFILIIFLTGFFTTLVYEYLFYIRILSAIILLAIGILMWLDYPISFGAISPRNNDGIIGSFILGLLTSISWAPCYSAYLISLIALLVSSNDAVYAKLCNIKNRPGKVNFKNKILTKNFCHTGNNRSYLSSMGIIKDIDMTSALNIFK